MASLRAARAAIFGVVLCLPTLHSSPVDCSRTFDNVGASFDLLQLSRPNTNYHVKDNMDSVERNYTYVFNVCDNVGNLPNPRCKTDPATDLAPAYQVSDSGCFKLANDPTDVEWALIDEADPTVGVSLTYLGGDICTPSNLDRKLTINFMCSLEQGLSQFEKERVVEDSCHYKLTVNTVFGCPNECFVGGNRILCSGNGFCGMDGDNKAPRCFCYDSYYGDACEIKAPEDSVGALGWVMILVLLLLSGLLVAAMWVYVKVGILRRSKLYELNDVDANSNTMFVIEDVDL